MFSSLTSYYSPLLVGRRCFVPSVRAAGALWAACRARVPQTTPGWPDLNPLCCSLINIRRFIENASLTTTTIIQNYSSLKTLVGTINQMFDGFWDANASCQSFCLRLSPALSASFVASGAGPATPSSRIVDLRGAIWLR